MAKQEDVSYFVYPTDAEEKDQAYAVFKFAKENGIARPQYIDADGEVWRWDNKGGGQHDGHRLIRTSIKYNRNARDRARRLDQSLSQADFEEAWPGKGADLYQAEVERQKQIFESRQDTEDIDHYWSLNSGGFHVSNNLRRQDSAANRSEGDRGVPHELEQAAYMLAETKADQVRLQGPRFAPGSSLELVYNGGKARLKYLLPKFNAVQNGIDIFNQGQSGSALDNALNAIPDTSETDLGRHLGNSITDGIKSAFKNGKEAVDTNGISTL
jgi:hypothetical protein|tara:strand:+ start:99 stop:908 length:810 start_codon:yes stop_codon:yes gene_type:complete